MTKDKTNISRAIRKIFKLLNLEKVDIKEIYIYSFFAGLVSLSLPLGIQSIIGLVMAGSISNSIVLLITLVLIGTFLSGLLQVRQLQLIEKIEQKYFTRYALEFGDRIPKLDIKSLDNYYLPELVNRFFDISGLQKSLKKILIDIPAAIIQVVLGTILLSFYHPLFIAFGLVLMLVIILILRYTSNKGFITSIETSDYKFRVAGWFEEMARSIKTFKYAQKTSLNIDKTDEYLSGYLNARTSHFKVLKVQFWSLIAFKLLITAAMLILGVSLLVDQQINIGQFIAADIVIISIIVSVEKLIGSMDQVYEALTSVEKLNKIAEAKIEERGNLKFPYKNEGVEIEFSDVSFSYDWNVNILNNITFNIKPGEWIGLIGNSGSGKTSILRLLTGAFRDFNGKILLDGVPIKNYDQISVRDSSGILLGRQDIFKGTLLENITLSCDDITVDEIMEVAHHIGFEEFIQSLPHGFDTEIGQEGNRLPSKMRHNILFCRSLIGKKRLLLLENPFIYVPKENINGLKDFLKKKNITLILTETELSKALGCDKIIYLENGKIVESI